MPGTQSAIHRRNEGLRAELPEVPLVAVMEPFPYRFMDEASTTTRCLMNGGRSTDPALRFHEPATLCQRKSSDAAWRKDLRHISATSAQFKRDRVQKSVAIDTSMAPRRSRPPQNNRVGDIDVFAVLHMMKKLAGRIRWQSSRHQSGLAGSAAPARFARP